MEIWWQQTTRISMKNENRDCITNVQWPLLTWRRSGRQSYPCRNKSAQKRREISDKSYVQKKTWDPFIRTILWNLLELAKGWIGIMRDQLRTDNTNGTPERVVRRVKGGTSSVLVQSGLQGIVGQKQENVMFSPNVLDPPGGGPTPNERRVNSPLEGRIISFAAEVKLLLLYHQKDQGRVHV